MLFMVGIETPADETQAFGIIVPVFEKLGYGCFSAADSQEEILFKAKEAILLMAEEVINDGHLIDALNEGYRDYRASHPEFDQWVAVEVPLEALKAKQKRLNITLSESQLARIDSFVAFHSEFKDRSDFLAKAADKLMHCADLSR
ncbi:MAG: type II toxin-antitoxin system HicB family antitoxin [Shewanella sp.]